MACLSLPQQPLETWNITTCSTAYVTHQQPEQQLAASYNINQLFILSVVIMAEPAKSGLSFRQRFSRLSQKFDVILSTSCSDIDNCHISSQSPVNKSTCVQPYYNNDFLIPPVGGAWVWQGVNLALCRSNELENQSVGIVLFIRGLIKCNLNKTKTRIIILDLQIVCLFLTWLW